MIPSTGHWIFKSAAAAFFFSLFAIFTTKMKLFGSSCQIQKERSYNLWPIADLKKNSLRHHGVKSFWTIVGFLNPMSRRSGLIHCRIDSSTSLALNCLTLSSICTFCRTCGTRSWRPTCGLSSCGTTTNWCGTPRPRAGWTCSTFPPGTSGSPTLSYTTSRFFFSFWRSFWPSATNSVFPYEYAIGRVFSPCRHTHCPKSNLNLRIKTGPFTSGVDATVYVPPGFCTQISGTEKNICISSNRGRLGFCADIQIVEVGDRLLEA